MSEQSLTNVEKSHLRLIANTSKYRPAPYLRQTITNLANRGYVESYTIRYQHIDYWRLTQKGLAALNES